LTIKFKQSDQRSLGHTSSLISESLLIKNGEFDLDKCVFEGSIARGEVSKQIIEIL
jgi:hypothetical protein